jgi:hypothetical protein
LLAQTPRVFGPRIAVARRHAGGIATANLTALLVFSLAPELQFELIHAREHLIVQLLNKRRITWESARIEILHLSNDAAYIPKLIGLVAECGA